MAERSFPIDPINPGHAFACMGFLEVANALGRGAAGGFEWDDGTETRFRLQWAEGADPVDSVLSFLARAEVTEMSETPTFPAPSAEDATKPCLLEADSVAVPLSFWVDASSRGSDLKHFAGGQKAPFIVREMVGLSARRVRGVRQIYDSSRTALVEAPFDILTPLGGSFKLDARGAWTPIDVGYSVHEQGHRTQASPVVEILGAAGLENARPAKVGNQRRLFRYGLWKGLASPTLARAALGAVNVGLMPRAFQFEQVVSNKYKLVAYAREEIAQ